LPIGHSNNAVAQITVDGNSTIFSFMGLTAGKTHTDISRAGYMWEQGTDAWVRIPDVPVSEGRLAATAVSVGGQVYLFGGYTVAEDGTEVSTKDNFRFDPVSKSYTRIAEMPVATDDAVSFAYLDRYVYLVSGWHNTGNISDVQVYDTKENSWFKASDYPGTPVFGHAGGIVGNQFVISDGVAVVGKDENGKRQFDTVNEGWMGTIDPEDPAKITYERLPQLPGRGHYRMGGAGDPAKKRVIFAGGTPDAYNYSGIGYNGEPSEPKTHVFAWYFEQSRWVVLPDLPHATMDLRGLVKLDKDWFTVGGMRANQLVTSLVSPINHRVPRHCDNLRRRIERLQKREK
jgi:N-acetylneuraminic acid mutarotase